MKQYKNFEKQPAKGMAEKSKIKGMLLQTYLISLLSLVLCVSMFFGTSYAWFTSEITNTANEIHVGTLDVGLFKKVGDTFLDIGDNDEKLFTGGTWAPDHTSQVTLRVVNEGDLPFKYDLKFIENGANEGDTQNSSTIARYFDVWVYAHSENGEAPEIESYEGVTEENGWDFIGTLSDVLADKAVLSGKLRAESENAQVETTDDEGLSSEDTYTIVLHMNSPAEELTEEEIREEIMGQTISLNVKLVAYQLLAEEESEDEEPEAVSYSEDDDTETEWWDIQQLQEALENGNDVTLDSDIELTNVENCITMAGGVLNGGNHTITYVGEEDDRDLPSVVTTYGGTISHLTIDGGDGARALYVGDLEDNLEVSNCDLSGVYAFDLAYAEETKYSVSFTDTVFGSQVSCANVVKQVSFTGCSFDDILWVYGDTTLTDCTFTGEYLYVEDLEDSETITLIDCTYNGKQIEKMILTANDGSLEMVGAENYWLDEEGMLIFSGEE